MKKHLKFIAGIWTSGLLIPHIISWNYLILAGSEYPYKLETVIICAITSAISTGISLVVEACE